MSKACIAFLAAVLVCHVAWSEDSSDESAPASVIRTQTSEIQPFVNHGEVPKAQQDSSAHPPITDDEFNAGPVPAWIWGPDDNAVYAVRTRFTLDTVTRAKLKASCDNVGVVRINGKQVGRSSEWKEPITKDVTEHLVEGENLLEASITNFGSVAGFVLKLAVRDGEGTIRHIVTDDSWKADTSREGAFSESVRVVGKLGDAPWGDVLSGESHPGRVPRDVFEVQPGFQVEKLFTVPKDELGSWVSITFDDKGRLLASDQGSRGICRITLPPPGAEEGETTVEQLDFSACDVQPTGAQGMLYAFDSLYLSVNGGPGSGLYRARDTDGDDQYDECVLLKKLKGGGEHGLHALRLSPDGTRIFMIAGNHTDPPFRGGEDLDNPDFTSRIPTNWDEDLLLPRMWDANGHARGRLAPGGWIASTDPDGRTWDMWSIGYRNPYDMAFNADGQLFAYDADMEWDVGAPWYRPTRVVHATSGSEFGWRSGTGKWPDYYHDSLPALVDIGPGSPVGVEFGYGTKFPARYQKALYLCDWTFGTMYAIHMTPHGSSYTAVKEEFLSRTPLPLTDVAAGPDGALYFTIGGRGTQSELFRVTYIGEKPTDPAELKEESFVAEREMRQLVESFHGRNVPMQEILDTIEKGKSDGLPISQLNAKSDDRALVTALRRLSQTESMAAFLMQSAQQQRRTDNNETIEIITALVRGVGRNGQEPDTVRSQAVEMLEQMPFDQLSHTEQLKYLRTLSLVWTRLGAPDDQEQQRFLELLDTQYPSHSSQHNRELCQVLVYLKSPTVVARTIELLNQEPQREDIDMGELLTRNAGYARAIQEMMASQPDRNQIWYAFCLRVAEVGWTTDLRADYFRWFGRARHWAGGHSFQKFLQNIDDEFWARTSENERILIEAAGARTPYRVAELPEPEGPGQEWTPDQVRQLAEDGLQDRNFENGQKMFAATRCVVCHRFAGNGGATGPDLTQLAGRFNLRDLTEAIMLPDKAISDQYRASSIATLDGQIVNGRIVAENDDQISVLTDPEDSTKVIDIAKDNIDEIVPSSTSLMPKSLLNRLNEEEVLDLLAYLLSRGDSGSPMFRQ